MFVKTRISSPRNYCWLGCQSLDLWSYNHLAMADIASRELNCIHSGVKDENI